MRALSIKLNNVRRAHKSVMNDFGGRTVLITGSGTGIGLASAKVFAGLGAGVIILGRRREPLEVAMKELEAIAAKAGKGAKIRMFPGVDVADEALVTAMFDQLERDGAKVDILINNAGVSGPVTCFANAPESDFESAVTIHLTGTFWTSAQALRVMGEGGIILTVTTFFTEERPLEQRPYRFRTPYTAAQGAKNRLAEALAAELVGRKITSIATNPGPVHSDRIYKTVYPKAAAEFLRVSGFEGLEPSDVAAACPVLLPALGEDKSTVEAAAKKAAGQGDSERLVRMLEKIGHIAEKIQKNTAAMIADRQFLSQDQLAHLMADLCGDRIAPTLSGKVIPGDRVFYPVRAHIGGQAPGAHAADLESRTLVIIVGATDTDGCKEAAALAERAQSRGAKAVMIIDDGVPSECASLLSEYHSHTADITNGQEISRWLGAASKIGTVAGVFHVTGSLPQDIVLHKLTRAEWDGLVERFVLAPARTVRAAMEHYVPGGATDPRLYKEAHGTVGIVGPAILSGKGAPEGNAVRAEVFRGALRPFVTTLNQELSDVLKSTIRTFLFLPGSVSGGQPDTARLADVLDYALSEQSRASAIVTFCTDELRA